MIVTIQYEAQLRELAGKSEAVFDISNGATIPEAMEMATADNEGLRDRILCEDGISRSILIFVNEQLVSREVAGGHTLNDGDTVLLIPPISGG